VGAGAAVGAAALLSPLGSSIAGAATTTSTGRAPVRGPGLDRAHWTALIGKRVAVGGPTGTTRATVVAVEDLRGAPAGDAGRFAVELRTDRGKPGIAGLRPITIPGRGVATLLVSAVDRGVRHRSFEIVVNTTSS
jgi:hypothetical protein